MLHRVPPTRIATSSTCRSSSRGRRGRSPSWPRRPSGLAASPSSSASRRQTTTRPRPASTTRPRWWRTGRCARSAASHFSPPTTSSTRRATSSPRSAPPRPARPPSACASCSPSARTSGTTSGSGRSRATSATPSASSPPAAARQRIPIADVNEVGGNDARVVDGGSMLVGRDGRILARGPLFEEAVVVAGADGDSPVVLRFAGAPALPPGSGDDTDADEVYRALALGLRDYARKCGFHSAVIGLSGGIDSALTACLAADALGPEHVFGVAMPSRYSSDHSREDAAALARNLGLRSEEIPIEPMHAAYLGQLEGALGHPLCDLAAQNVQARIRGQLLMAISNEEGSLCLSTGNKSELAVGYCTLYGDMAGGLAVIGDLPKTLVYRVARAANARAGRELVPESTFTKPPSAELKPDQTDQDTLPPYAELDDILAAYIEERLPLEAIAARGHAPETVRRVLRMVVGSEYKRRQ